MHAGSLHDLFCILRMIFRGKRFVDGVRRPASFETRRFTTAVLGYKHTTYLATVNVRDRKIEQKSSIEERTNSNAYLGITNSRQGDSAVYRKQILLFLLLPSSRLFAPSFGPSSGTCEHGAIDYGIPAAAPRIQNQ